MTLEEHLARIEPELNSGCWLWAGNKDCAGYGMGRVGGRNVLAHRIIYEAFKGPIPVGLVIDHLCRTPLCVNPNHLEAVTQRVNVLRGKSFAARHAVKTHCDSGHPFSGENLHWVAGRRQCRACNRRSVEKYRAAGRGKRA